MVGPLQLMQQPFLDRLRAPRAWSAVAYVAPRWGLALSLALAPAALLVLAVAFGPAGLGVAVTDPQHVRDAFARYVSAVATASAIAVSVAVLALRRELRGIGAQRERQADAEAFRDRVRDAAGLHSAPLSLGPFLGAALEALRDTARRARRAATREELERERDGVRLGEFLDVLESVSERVRGEVVAVRRRPDLLARAALDFEEEASSHYARRFARMDGASAALAAELDALSDRVSDVTTGAKYAKTLDLQWGLSRMSTAIAATSLPAILAATAVVLAYGDGAIAALGVVGASVLVAAALVVALLPLACFVSYILRFVFLNEHTLPTDSFVLGPESVGIVERESSTRSALRGRGGSGRPGA